MNLERMIVLTEREIALVKAADAEVKPTSRRTRRYTLLRDRGAGHNFDIAFVQVAARHIGGELCIKPIALTSVDCRRTIYSGDCDIRSGVCGLYTRFVVGWCEADRDRFAWMDGRAWKTEDRADGKDRTRYWVWCERMLNWDEVIEGNPRFRYNAWGGYCSALDWLRRYSSAPEIENLAKMGLNGLASVRFVERLRRDKGLFRFVRENLAEIKGSWRFGPAAVYHAYAHGLTVAGEIAYREEVSEVKSMRRDLPDELPKRFDFRAANRYLKRSKVSRWEYSRYLRYCMEGGADLLAPQTAFPPNIERRLADFDLAAKRREKREKRERSRNLRELAEKYASAVAHLRLGGFCAVFPATAADFVREGKAMNNCIGGGNYTLRHAEGLCVCVFIRKADAPDKPFVDVEIAGGKVRQCYARNNQNADGKVRKVADRIARAISKTISRKAA